jgi:hypothetical protein
MIPINEELNRLHQPVILYEEDTQWDVSSLVATLQQVCRDCLSAMSCFILYPHAQTALNGFSVTSCISRPEVNHGRRASAPLIPSATPPLYPTTTPKYRQHHRNHHSYGGGSSQIVYHTGVFYPVASTRTATTTRYGGVRPYQYQSPVMPSQRQHYVHQDPGYGSPAAIPRVSW